MWVAWLSGTRIVPIISVGSFPERSTSSIVRASVAGVISALNRAARLTAR